MRGEPIQEAAGRRSKVAPGWLARQREDPDDGGLAQVAYDP